MLTSDWAQKKLLIFFFKPDTSWEKSNGKLTEKEERGRKSYEKRLKGESEERKGEAEGSYFTADGKRVVWRVYTRN